MDKYREYWKEKMPEVINKLKAASQIEIGITDIVKVSNRKYNAKFKILNQKTYTAITGVESIDAPKTYGHDFFEELMETLYFKMHLVDKTLLVEISDRDKDKSIPIKLKVVVVQRL